MRSRVFRWLYWVGLPVAAVLLLAGLGCSEEKKEQTPMQPASGQVRIEPTHFAQLYEVYEDNRKQGWATLITSDSVLHTTHLLYDYTLRAAEAQHFDAALRQLSSLMTERMAQLAEEESHRQYITAPPPYGYDRVAAYFGVAQQLLNPDASVPAIIRPMVKQEVALILAHNGTAQSPVLGILEDYTQYTPRGHYTRNEALQRYFRAMMWYGRAGFPISGEKAPGVPLTQQEARANAWAGMVLARNMAELVAAQVDTASGGRAVTGMDLWAAIYRPTAFLVGPSDDLTPQDYLTLSRQVFGETLPGAWTSAEQAKTDQFIAAATKLRPPQIIGGVQAGTTPPVSLRLFGQRFVPDSLIFQRLVEPNVPGRALPSGLDVMAVLGSRAAEVLLQQKGELDRPGYRTHLGKLRMDFAAFDDAAWTQNGYRIWLHTLQPLVDDPAWTDTFPADYLGKARPAWWKDPVWVAKQLNAGLGSWAELRHDTMLYAKQSYTTRAIALPDPGKDPVVYVEPVPQVYGGLIRLLSATREQLTAQGVFPSALAPNYDELTRLLRALLLISTQETLTPEEQKTADVEKPTADDLQRARDVGTILKRVETLPAPLREQLTGGEDAQTALIADVHTDPQSGKVLEVAVGPVLLVSAPVPDGAGTVQAYGPAFSYYEFAQPMDDRLTDAAWQQRITAGRLPEPFVLGPYLSGR